MKTLFALLLERCKRGQATQLVTVVAEMGSAPRHAGASMVVGEDGRLGGTIGGGVLEYSAVQSAQSLLATGQGGLRKYQLTRIGMVCGGNVDLLFTYIYPSEVNQSTLTVACDHSEKHKTGWLMLPYTGVEFGFYSREEGLFGLSPAFVPERRGEQYYPAGKTETPAGTCYIQKLMNSGRIYVFGGGHIAQALIPLLEQLNFRCTVTDDRAEYSTRELFPCAEEVHTLDYVNLADEITIQPQDCIVIITRGHKCDYEVLRFALRTSAYYIGVAGSRTKIATLTAAIKADGFNEHDIARITAPIGIKIKSETPAEIAVSIAAQLIEQRALYTSRSKIY